MQTSVKIVHKFSEGLVSSTFTFGHLIVTSGDTKASSKRQGMFAFILYATFLFFFWISSLLKACSFSVSIIVKWVAVFQEGMVKMIVAGEAFLTPPYIAWCRFAILIACCFWSRKTRGCLVAGRRDFGAGFVCPCCEFYIFKSESLILKNGHHSNHQHLWLKDHPT